MAVDPELQAQLQREAASGLPPRSERSVEMTRALYFESSRALAGPPAVLPRVEEAAAEGVPMRIYAASQRGPLPAMVYFHGGRFFSGNLDTHDGLCRILARESGCVIVAVDYRLAPEHPFPAAVEDCLTAVRWTASQAAEIGIDPTRIAVGGDSAGACLAAVAAVLARDGGSLSLRAQWLVYPMLDPGCALVSHRTYATGYGPGSEDMLRGWREYQAGSNDPRVSPLYTGSFQNLPPAYVLTAEFDTLRDEGELYARNLHEAGVPVKLARVPGAIHGFFQMTGVSQLARRWTALAACELRGMLKEV